MPAAEAEMTIDELARAAGSKVSTLRLYQQRGLLPSPRLEGRIGYYGPSHLARLRLVASLQERGYSLAAIRELVEGWESGRDLSSLLGVERQLVANAGNWTRMSRDDLVAQIPGLADDSLLRRAAALGALRLDDDGTTADVHEGFLAVGTTLARLGVPADVQLDEFARVLDFARESAARFVGLFEQYVLEPALQSEHAGAELAELATTLEGLRAAATAVVSGALQQALDEEAERAMPRYAPRLLPK
jgi:DNA-binding transcriptional MerR regulator